MATLGNFLARRGGTAMTCVSIEINLTIFDPATGPLVDEITVTVAPLSMAARSRSEQDAKLYVEQQEEKRANGDLSAVVPPLQREKKFRLICESLRDSEDIRKYFVDSKSVDQFREMLLDEQLAVLLAAYEELVLREYPEVRARTEELIAASQAQAQEAFTGGQG